MLKKENSDAGSPAQLEYKLKGDFLNIKMPIIDVKIKSVRAKAGKRKRSIEIADPQDESKSIFINGKGKIGQFADFLGVKRILMLNLVEYREDYNIQAIIDRQPANRIVQFNASKFTYTSRDNKEVTRFYIFAVSTTQHIIVTFREIESVVKAVLGDDVTDCYFGTVKVFVKTYDTFEIASAGESFLSSIQVTTGKNTKASAIKVVVRVKVGSCSNSIICANYTAIKRTENCLDRLRNTLITANEVIESTQEIITAGAQIPMTLEEGLTYIDNIKVSIKNEEKIQNIKDALKVRFKLEYEGLKTRFALSQALSFGGTHFLAEKTSERTLEMLSEQSFEVLAAAILPIQQAIQ